MPKLLKRIELGAVLFCVLFGVAVGLRALCRFYEPQKSNLQENTPDYLAVRGWTNTIEKLHLDADVVFLGNSITFESNFEELFESDSLLIVNLGYPGDGIMGIIRRLDMISSCHPDRIFLMVGINDLKYQSLTDFCALYGQLVDSILCRLPNSSLYLESILPISSKMKDKYADNEKIILANECVKTIAIKHYISYIDLHHLYYDNGEMADRYTRDGIHLNPDAYKLWANEIHKYLFEK